MKAKIFTWLTVLIFIPTYFMDYYDLQTAYIVNDVAMMLQATLLAVVLYSFIENKFYKIFLSYLILWRLTGTAAAYINYYDAGKAQVLSYAEIGLLVLSIIHLGFKWYISTRRS